MSEGDVRERILAEATRLFGEQGYGLTSVRDVARAVGVTNPTLYYHFGSKEGLYLEAIRVHQEAIYDRLVEVVNRPASVRERIRAYVQVQFEATAANRSAARLMMYANHRPESGEPQVDMMSVHLKMEQLLGKLFAEGVANGELRPDVEVIDGLMAVTGPVILGCYAVVNQLPTPDDLVDRIVDVIFRGLGA
ncbi:MAG: TetR/AcrR family transcriptional regulator [Deltaproteobacteria bacterium]|nr:TetR/AcrR family transcriptional regulator [Deltaproteobacteria bacterium]